MSAVLVLLAAMSLTGANVPFGKIIAETLPVYDVLAFRFVIATAALALLAGRQAFVRLAALGRRDWLDIGILAAIGSVLFTVLLLEGTKRTAAVDAGIITGSLPAVVALLSVVVLRQRMGRAAILCVALAAAGVMIIQTAAPASGTSSLAGNGLVGLAVLCEAIFVLASRRLSMTLHPIDLSLAVSGVSAVLSIPLAAIHFDSSPAFAAELDVWLLAVWYALSASVFCTILWYAGVGKVPSWMAGLATTALPVTALIVSAVALGEAISMVQALGAGLVVAAIAAGALLPRNS